MALVSRLLTDQSSVLLSCMGICTSSRIDPQVPCLDHPHGYLIYLVDYILEDMPGFCSFVILDYRYGVEPRVCYLSRDAQHVGGLLTAPSARRQIKHGQAVHSPRGECLHAAMIVLMYTSGQRVAAFTVCKRWGRAPLVVGAGPGAHRPRGLAAPGQLGRVSSLVEVDVAI